LAGVVVAPAKRCRDVGRVGAHRDNAPNHCVGWGENDQLRHNRDVRERRTTRDADQCQVVFGDVFVT
jgi:hypothetical protein